MNQNKIKQVLRLHGLWIKNDPKGQKAILTGADLSGASLRYASLSDASLLNANLEDADLGRADLSGADLEGADLTNANLRYANLGRADLSDANLSDAILTGADLFGAIFDKETKFPEGFDPVAHGMILGEEEEVSAVLAKHGLTLGKNVTLNINFIG